jgi:hypothetical protein
MPRIEELRKDYLVKQGLYIIAYLFVLMEVGSLLNLDYNTTPLDFWIFQVLTWIGVTRFTFIWGGYLSVERDFFPELDRYLLLYVEKFAQSDLKGLSKENSKSDGC